MNRATVTATAATDPLSGVPIVTIAIQGPLPGAQPITATVLRSNRQYVLGASPLNPLTLAPDGTASVVDRTAAYGVDVSYVVGMTQYVPGGPPTTAPPSKPSKPVEMGQAPDTLALYNRLGWAQSEDTSGQLLDWISGLAELAQTIDSLSWDGYDTAGNPAPGWSQVLDIERCPTAWLPWLAQFVGVTLDPAQRDDQHRYAIENPQGWARGTPATIIAAVNNYLAAGYTATLLERDTSAYHLTIDIPTGGYQGTTTYSELSHRYPNCAAVFEDVATYQLLWNSVPHGSISGATTYGTIWAMYATYLVLATTVATYADLWATDFLISQAVEAAIPAGLQYNLTYT